MDDAAATERLPPSLGCDRFPTLAAHHDGVGPVVKVGLLRVELHIRVLRGWRGHVGEGGRGWRVERGTRVARSEELSSAGRPAARPQAARGTCGQGLLSS